MFLFPDSWREYDDVSVGQLVKLKDGRAGRVAGFYFNEIRVKFPNGDETTIPQSELNTN